MYRFKVIATVLIVLMATAVLSPETEAQQWNKRTIVTITRPMEIQA
jgi:hypothetical protein